MMFFDSRIAGIKILGYIQFFNNIALVMILSFAEGLMSCRIRIVLGLEGIDERKELDSKGIHYEF